MNDFPIAYIISPAISALLLPFLLARKTSNIKKILLINISIIIFSSIIPVFLDNAQIKSILQFTLEGNIYMGFMLFGYLLSWIILFRENPKSVLLIFYLSIASYLLFWVGVVTEFGWDNTFIYGPGSDPLIRYSSLAGSFLYIILPLINGILFSSLLTQKKQVEIDLTKEGTYKIKGVSNYLGKIVIIAIFLGSLFLFYNVLNLIDKNNFLLTFVLVLISFVALWKMMYSVLIYEIDFDFKNRIITLHKTFGKSIIEGREIRRWGIREFYSDYIWAPAEAMAFVELDLNDGRKVSYPLISWEYGKTEIHKFRSAFEKAINKPQIQLKPSGFALMEKNWLWFFTI